MRTVQNAEDAGKAGVLAPDARPRWWLLRKAGWIAVLALGVTLLTWQVATVSQSPNDFCQDYIAAQRLIHGEMPYLPLQSWAGYAACPVALPYDAHPPFSVLLFVPFALLPKTPAALIWGLCSLAAYLTSGVLLLKELKWRLLPGMALLALGSCFWTPLALAQQTQNLEQVLLLLLVVAWLLERRGHDRWAGALLGLAALLKLWPLGLLLGALIWRKWRLALTGGLVALLALAVTLIVPGPAAYAAYLGPVRVSELNSVPTRASISLVGAITRVFTGYPAQPSIPPLVTGLSLPSAVLVGELIAALFFLLVLAMLWWKRKREPGSPAELLGQGMLITALLLTFPLIWYQSLILLLLPLATLALALRQLPKPPRWWKIVLWMCLVVLAIPGWMLLDLPGTLITYDAQRLSGIAAVLASVPTVVVVLLAAEYCILLREG
ncbi:MAG TPA: glycosyltransferase family 87 protein [Ktedonobacterales bacterium]|nr:glycosyltransferase family 87 protein [Ktedonobacterales bacterium]